MAMVFTVRRALFLSSIFFILLSCQHQPQTAVIPAVWIDAADTGLLQHEGFLYYHGKKFSGRLLARYPSGDTALLASYLGGKEEGVFKKWYETGVLAEERPYANGQKIGLHRGWWPSGKLKFQYAFQKDDYEGEVKEWFRSGVLAKRFHYTAGHEDGLEQLWWEDGKTRANYVVKDGQQYGLIGRKLCRNYDSPKTK